VIGAAGWGGIYKKKAPAPSCASEAGHKSRSTRREKRRDDDNASWLLGVARGAESGPIACYIDESEGAAAVAVDPCMEDGRDL
jgi:hypothetical protein